MKNKLLSLSLSLVLLLALGTAAPAAPVKVSGEMTYSLFLPTGNGVSQYAGQLAPWFYSTYLLDFTANIAPGLTAVAELGYTNDFDAGIIIPGLMLSKYYIRWKPDSIPASLYLGRNIYEGNRFKLLDKGFPYEGIAVQSNEVRGLTATVFINPNFKGYWINDTQYWVNDPVQLPLFGARADFRSRLADVGLTVGLKMAAANSLQTSYALEAAIPLTRSLAVLAGATTYTLTGNPAYLAGARLLTPALGIYAESSYGEDGKDVTYALGLERHLGSVTAGLRYLMETDSTSGSAATNGSLTGELKVSF